jgi:hypothetical protein
MAKKTDELFQDDPEQAAKIAVQAYDPSEDPRLWKAMSDMWKSVCVEFVDVACGYAGDGRPANEIAARLQKELADRIAQENSSFAEFKQQFQRTAAEWLVRRRSDVVTADMRQQMMELDRERQAAVARAAERDRESRERQAAELERQAAELRSGPQSRTTSYLAR